jgi:hypothetical protein
MCDVEQVDRWPSNQRKPRPLVRTKVDADSGSKGIGVILQNRPKRCVMMDVHQRCL